MPKETKIDTDKKPEAKNVGLSAVLASILHNWKEQGVELKKQTDLLMEARKILPKGLVDAPLNELFVERSRLAGCTIDLQDAIIRSKMSG